MSDPIERSDAIDVIGGEAEFIRRALDDMGLVGDERSKFEWGLGLLESCIYDMRELPSAQQWIPCSERLPEDEYVLISKKPTKISGSKWSVAIAIRTADQRSGRIQWRDSGFGVIQDDKVLAWMPLPEAYEYPPKDFMNPPEGSEDGED